MPGPEKNFDPEVALVRAMEVFWQRGYEAASLSQLLARMGIGKKSLYDTFGNKRALFIKVLDLYGRQHVDQIRKALNEHPSPMQSLEGLLLRWAEAAAAPKSHGCLLGTNIADFDTEDQEIAAILRSKLERLEDAFSDCLERAKEAGELKPSANPREIARQLICLSQGIALLGRIHTGNDLSKSVIQQTLKQIS